MKRLLFTIVSIILFTGCDTTTIKAPSNPIYNTSISNAYYKICIDNIYYIVGDHRMALYIEEKTLLPKRCE